MTVSSELATATRSWTGQTSIATGFIADNAADVTVIATNAQGGVTTLSRGVHYSSTVDSGTRELILLPSGAMPPQPQTLTIRRRTPALQPISLNNNAKTYDAAALEKELDRNAMRDAEVRAAVDGLEPRVETLENALPEIDADKAMLLATQAEAEGGTNVNKVMNPLRTKQSVNVELDAVYDDIEAVVSDVGGHATRLTTLEASYGGVSVATSTWSALNALSGTFAGQAAEVDASDTGTHTDPVVGGTVSNYGRFAWSSSPAGWKRIGDSPPAFSDTAGANMFYAGRYPDEAEFLFSTNAVTNTASAALIALGFDRCVAKAASETSIVYGERLSFTMLGNEYYSARVYIQKDSGSANYGVPRLYFYSGGGYTLLGYVAMTLESTIDSTAAIYSVNGQATSTYAGADLIAVGCAVSTGTGLGVMGGQFHVSPRRARQVPSGAYPAEGNENAMLLPDTLFMAAGEPMPVYVPNLMTRRWPDDETVLAVASVRASDNYPHVIEGHRQLILDPDKMGTTAMFDYRPRRRDFDRRRRKTLNVEVAPSSGIGGTRKVLLIGDSLTNRGQGFIIDERCVAAGQTITWQGTVTGQNRAGAASGKVGEAREGKSLQDFVSVASGLTNVAVGGEAAYLALSNNNKMSYNPFNSGSGFDFAGAYVARFLGGTNPDDVIIGLGTNDITQQSASSTATFIANFEACFDIMQTSIRAAGAGIRIGWWLPVQPRSKTGDQRWVTKHRAMIASLIKKVRALGDANTHVIGAWMHMTQEVGWDLEATPAADTETGIQHAAFSDVTHFSTGAIREQVGRVLANFIKAA